MTKLKNAEFDAWYQEACDKQYWSIGQCCAGCDHWISSKGLTGQCSAAEIVSGYEVLKSMGASFSSYIPKPGLPWTQSDSHCGKFSDAFDWSTLDWAYLIKIGAVRNGALRETPKTVASLSAAPD